jgi:hypothetical protein
MDGSLPGACWTGISAGNNADSNLAAALLAARQGLPEGSEPPDSDWKLWRWWRSLGAGGITPLHNRLAGEERRTSQQQIVSELLKWAAVLDQTILQAEARSATLPTS